MLILTRKLNGAIYIGDDTVIRVLKIHPPFEKGRLSTAVDLGIITSDGVAIWREEIYIKIKKEQEQFYGE